MPVQKRHKTKHPGVYFIEGKCVPGSGRKVEKIFYITYRKDGQQIHERAGYQFRDNMTPSKAAGMRARRVEGKELSNRAAREQIEAAKAAEAGRWTINKLWGSYCEHNPGNKGLRAEKRKFDLHIRGGLGVKEPCELVALDVDRLRLSLQNQGKKTMAVRVLELLRRTVNYGVSKGLISPLSFKVAIPRLNNQTTEDLSEDQLRKLLTVLDTHADQVASNIMRLALFSGMRRSEILKLRWDDVDFKRAFITLTNPKGGRDEQIPLNDMVEQTLKSIIPGESPFVFPGRIEGQCLTNCKGIRKIAKIAGLPKGFRPVHGLRHVYASMLASSGEVDMFVLQKLLTHKSPTMTMRYAHLRDQALKRAANVAGNLFAGIAKKEDGKVANLNGQDIEE